MIYKIGTSIIIDNSTLKYYTDLVEKVKLTNFRALENNRHILK